MKNTEAARDRRYRTLVRCARFAMTVALTLKITCDEETKRLKKSDEPFIVLVQHPSMLDAAVLYCALMPRVIHTVAGRFQYVGKKSEPIFHAVNAISKKQFYSDIASVRDMLHVLKNGGVLAMMPEGRVSQDGTGSPIDPTTAAFVKKCGVPVAVLAIRGSYGVMPSWREFKLHLGHVSAELKLLFTKEELEQTPAETVREKIDDAMSYDQFAGKKIRFIGRPKGISNILYRCPECGAVGSLSDHGRLIVCTECGRRVRVGKDLYLHAMSGKPAFPTIAEWNAWQKGEDRVMLQSADAKLTLSVRCRFLDENGRHLPDETDGILTLSREGLSYTDREGKDNFFRELEKMPGVSADYTLGNIMVYEKEGARIFWFENSYSTSRFVNALMLLREDAV